VTLFQHLPDVRSDAVWRI